MPHADVAFVNLKVALGKLSRLDGNSEICIAPKRPTLGSIWLKGLHRHTNGNTGITVVAAGAIKVPTTATKALVGQMLVSAAGNDSAGIGK